MGGAPCNQGALNACQPGLECVPMPGGMPTPGGAGTCEVKTPNGLGAPCQGGVQKACAEGLNCVGAVPGSAGTCQPNHLSLAAGDKVRRIPNPFANGEGAPCNQGVSNACQPGLECVPMPGGMTTPGGAGTCEMKAPNGPGAPCNQGALNACQPGLECIPMPGGMPTPGGAGTCEVKIPNGLGAPCHGGVQAACAEGLNCVSAVPGGAGTCQPNHLSLAAGDNVHMMQVRRIPNPCAN